MLNYQRVNHSWICWRPPWLALVTRHSSGGCGDELSRRQPSNLRWDPDQQCPTEPPKLSWWGSPATEKCHSTRFPCHPLPTNNSPPHRHPELLLGPMGSAQDGENSRPSANAWMAATDPLHPPSGYTKISRFANDVNGQTFRFSLPPIPQRSMLLVRITPCLYNIHKCRSISIRGNFNHHWTNVGKAMRTNPCCDGLSNPFMVKKMGMVYYCFTMLYLLPTLLKSLYQPISTRFPSPWQAPFPALLGTTRKGAWRSHGLLSWQNRSLPPGMLPWFNMSLCWSSNCMQSSSPDCF